MYILINYKPTIEAFCELIARNYKDDHVFNFKILH